MEPSPPLELPSSTAVEKPRRRAGVVHHLIQEHSRLEVDPGGRLMGEVRVQDIYVVGAGPGQPIVGPRFSRVGPEIRPPGNPG